MKNLIASIGIILFIVGGCAMDGPLLIPVVAVLVGLGLICIAYKEEIYEDYWH